MESPDDVITALVRDPSELIGQRETQWLDFKSRPYFPPDDDSPWRKLELAKDVSAMANAGGGIIVLGVRTEQDEEIQEEVAVELRPFPGDLIQRKVLEDVIEEWVFPRPAARIADYEHASLGDGKKIWSIHVEPGSPRDLPFLVAKELRHASGGDGTRQLFGLYERVGTNNRARDSAVVHQWIKVGYREDTFGVRPSTDSREEERSAAEEEDSANAALAGDLEAISNQANEASLSIQFLPRAGSCSGRFYEGDPDSLFSALERLRQLRDNGFNLPWRAPLETAPQGGYRKAIPGKGSLSVLSNGLTTAILAEESLTWASRKYSPKASDEEFREIYVNPLSIPEFVLEACRFFLQHVLPRCPASTQWVWRTSMSGVSIGVPLSLPRYALDSADVLMGHEVANQGEDYKDPWERGASTDPEILAHTIVQRIYGHFHLGADFIMYRSSEGDRIVGDRILSGQWRAG